MPWDLERALLLHSDGKFMHRTGQFVWKKMKRFIKSQSEIRVRERKYHWLLFFQSDYVTDYVYMLSEEEIEAKS